MLAGLLNVPAMFSQIELSTAMPKSGGSYFTIERSLGTFAGVLAGLISWLCISFKAAFACVGIGGLTLLIFPGAGDWIMRAVAIWACLVFTALNLTTVRGTGHLQGVLVFALLGVLALYVFAGAGSISATRYVPFFTSDWRSFFAVTGMVFVSYGGLTKVVDVAEEVRNPRRNLVLGMFLSFAVVNVFYAATVFVTTGLLNPSDLSGSLAPLSIGAEAVMGLAGIMVMSIAAFLAYATTANAGILAASRSPLAMSRDGLFPAGLSLTSKRFGTPVPSVALTALFIVIVIGFLTVEELVKTASTMFLISFALANASVVVMRSARIQGYRPSFRAPLCPWLNIAAILVYAFLIADMGRIPLLATAGFLAAAGIWYATYVHRRVRRESAIVYMVRAILSKQIKRTGLEDELLRISLERQGIKGDRFDQLIRNGLILDVERRIDATELFRRVSDELGARLSIDSDVLYDLFLAREMESSTVISPGLAIPHIVVEGRGVFDVALVRCRPGIVFSGLHAPVHTCFFLVGSSDERSFHLRVLVAIAHIVQEPDFEERWKEARNEGELRDIVLLSRRKRIHVT